MRKITSQQRNVNFSFCPSPVTIDKSEEWGEGNVQEFPNGAYLKHDDAGIITHGVQPNDNLTSPVGWISDDKGYQKLPIWIGEYITDTRLVSLQTLDGVVNYQVNKPSYICYNGDEKPNNKDCWVQSEEELIKNYNL